MGAILLVGIPAGARADKLTSETFGTTEAGYAAVEELSYEAIFDASRTFTSQLRIRVALHNGSAVARDAVHALALPRGSELRSIATARDGVWTEGRGTRVATGGEGRDPGTVFVRPIPPERPGELPGAEVVASGLDPGVTIQVELRVRVYPQLRGDRWQLELPDRGKERVALASTRRVLVQGLEEGAEFWVDGAASGTEPMMHTFPGHPVTVAWPAHRRNAGALQARYEVRPDPDRAGGKLRVYLRLGQTTPPNPDHVLLLVDRSRSTSVGMQRDATHLAQTLFEALPESATFDAIGFARHARPLGFEPDTSVADPDARQTLARTLDENVREQGTDLRAALDLAGERLAARRATRPLVLVITDGMLPGGLDLDAMTASFVRRLGSSARPDVLFVVDDPVLLGAGVRPDHPIAEIAAALGARISLEPLADGRFHRRTESSRELLAAPHVLGDLSIELPTGATLERPPPAGLVAGALVVMHGHYQGRTPGRIRIKGHFGARNVRRQLKPVRQQTVAPALVAVADGVADLESAVRDGFSLPAWYSSDDRQRAQLGITRAGRSGYEARGQLDRRIILSYLRMRVLPRAQVCYKHAVARDQTQGGRVVFDIQIGKGEVMLAKTSAVELHTPDPSLLSCLEEAAWALDIPAAKLDGQVYRLRYPLRLTPPKGGIAPAVDDPLGQGSLKLILDSFPGSN